MKLFEHVMHIISVTQIKKKIDLQWANCVSVFCIVFLRTDIIAYYQFPWWIVIWIVCIMMNHYFDIPREFIQTLYNATHLDRCLYIPTNPTAQEAMTNDKPTRTASKSLTAWSGHHSFSQPHFGASEGTYDMSYKMCTRMYCVLVCCGLIMRYGGSMWYIYPYSPGIFPLLLRQSHGYALAS